MAIRPVKTQAASTYPCPMPECGEVMTAMEKWRHGRCRVCTARAEAVTKRVASGKEKSLAAAEERALTLRTNRLGVVE